MILPIWILRLFSYLAAFNLGGYCVMVKYGGNVEWYRWAGAIILLVYFQIATNRKPTENEKE